MPPLLSALNAAMPELAETAAWQRRRRQCSPQHILLPSLLLSVVVRPSAVLLSAFSPPLSLSPPFGLGFGDGRTDGFADGPTHALSSSSAFSRCD